MSRPQTTLRTSVSIEGVGLHSGHPVRAHFRPAPPETGLALRPARSRGDPDPGAGFLGLHVRLRDDPLLGRGLDRHRGARALGRRRRGLDNCRIEIEGPEVPILDGSALPFVRLFHAAGFERQDAPVHPLTLDREVTLERGDRSIRYSPDGDALVITYEIDFPAPLRRQTGADVDRALDDYAARIAPARTFGFLPEVEAAAGPRPRARGVASERRRPRRRRDPLRSAAVPRRVRPPQGPRPRRRPGAPRPAPPRAHPRPQGGARPAHRVRPRARGGARQAARRPKPRRPATPAAARAGRPSAHSNARLA